MTVTPTTRGFPDYMYPNGAAGAVIFSQTYLNSPIVTLGPFDVSSWPVLQLTYDGIAVGGGSTHMVIRYNWDVANSGGGTKPFKNVRSLGNCTVYDSCWNYGSQLTIQLDPEPGGGTFSGTLELWCRGGQPGPMTAVDTVCNVPVGNIAAGAATTTNASIATPGPALLNYSTGGLVPTYLALDVLTAGGIWTQMYGFQTLVAGEAMGAALITLPSSQTRIRLGNQSGGVQSFAAAIVPQGY